MPKRIGVLALQGNYALHQQSLQALGLEAPLIYKPSELHDLDGLVVPGGETTALLKLMTPLRWQDTLLWFKQQGKLLLGTCAGMILFARDVDPEQESLNLIDISVLRNGYGRQRDSHVVTGECDQAALGVAQCEMVFIRAPKITRVGDAVQVLATSDGVPVCVRQGNVLCASFHPELSTDNGIHRYFFID
ncbi:MAG: pyridoxal 5'-phosphate synthase glutaminase subunit PdxT [Coxiella sp. (in: Bacteria)]|nr:MAG: pyridoxal 5'-phosphate synthase glutaminase subunit PdxT [Coxiella sp. (in: g-proteobacteria)]